MDATNTPLAERMRPSSLSEYIGQEHLVAPGAPLHTAINKNILPSIILWGPPGVGKTTLANIISKVTKRPFYTLSAISSGVKDVREIITRVKNQGMFGGNNAILFIDEIHRFSKSQQDSLLGAVEKGIVTLIGATTENPSFEVIPALLSRCQVYVLQSLKKVHLTTLLAKVLKEDAVINKLTVTIKENNALLRLSGGDARKLLNLLDACIASIDGNNKIIDDEIVMRIAQQQVSMYDKNGEQHYDIISAFIKSIRGSDPNAAVYWLARMVEGGEKPEFIARRLLILSSEDIGNANPTAMVIANNCFQAIHAIGWPEGRIILSQCVIYLACSPKSNASYKAIKDAQELVKKTGDLPVPLSLRNAPTELMKELDYGKDYNYVHGEEGNFAQQDYLPKEILGTLIYNPGNNQKENSFAKDLKEKWVDKYNY